MYIETDIVCMIASSKRKSVAEGITVRIRGPETIAWKEQKLH